jgi:hypothetical protein
MLYQLVLPGEKGEKKVEIPYPSGFKFTDPASIINEAFKYLFPLAGLILFFTLIAGGFQLLTAAGNEETIQKAQKKITAAIIGFVILFVSFWLMKLLQFIFGFKVL